MGFKSLLKNLWLWHKKGLSHHFKFVDYILNKDFSFRY